MTRVQREITEKLFADIYNASVMSLGLNRYVQIVFATILIIADFLFHSLNVLEKKRHFFKKRPFNFSPWSPTSPPTNFLIAKKPKS